jgi:hypothetical protein
MFLREVGLAGFLGAVVMAVALGQAVVARPAAKQAGEKKLSYTLFIFETPEQFALRGDTTDAGKAYWGSFATYGAELNAAGIMRGGAPLAERSLGQLVSIRGGRQVVSSGTVIKSAEGLHLGGYFQIEVSSPEQALAWAAKAPNAATGVVEVRPGIVLPGQ